MPVLAANTIILNGVTYTLADTDVFERSIDQFPAKIVIGDRRLKDQSLASEWVFVGDLTDGAGVRTSDPSIHQRRFWRALNVDSRWKNRLVLGPERITSLTTNVPADAPVWMGHWVDDDIIVMVTPTAIRYHTGSGDWAVPTAPASGIISGGVSAIEYKSALLIATGSSYWYGTDAGDTFTQSSFANDDARFFCVFDQKLIRISASGDIYWTTFDHTGAPAASNWTAKTAALPNHTINGMIVWHDLDGAPAIFIATTRGLYIFDFDSDRLYEYAAVRWTYGDTYHAWAMAVWNSDLYVSDNRSLLRITDSGVQNVGPDRDDGFDVQNGRIRWLLPLQNFLLAAIDTGGQTSRTSYIWAYNGRGWHNITSATATNADITTLAFRSNRLFFNQAALSRYLSLPDSSEHPLDISGTTFIAGTVTTAYLQTPFFDGGLANVDKNALAVVIEVQNLISGDLVAVYYDTNDNGGAPSYSLLGSNINSNGQTTLNFGTGGVGEVFRSISFRVGLTRATGTNTATPVVISAKLRYMETPSQLYAYTFAVDLRGGMGDSEITKRANLITAKDSQLLVVLQLANPPQSITGRVSMLQGVRNGKSKRLPTIYNVTFVQPV